MENLTQTISEKVEMLPLEKQREVLEFVENLQKSVETKKKSLLDKLKDISNQVPEKIWETIPNDGAEQHDHYLYGNTRK